MKPTLTSLRENIRRAQNGVQQAAAHWADIEYHARDAERLLKQIEQTLAKLGTPAHK
jgi:hypothetical protein